MKSIELYSPNQLAENTAVKVLKILFVNELSKFVEVRGQYSGQSWGNRCFSLTGGGEAVGPMPLVVPLVSPALGWGGNVFNGETVSTILTCFPMRASLSWPPLATLGRGRFRFKTPIIASSIAQASDNGWDSTKLQIDSGSLHEQEFTNAISTRLSNLGLKS